MIKHKFFLVNLPKEEEWINQYVAKGYRLKKFNGLGRYEFEMVDKEDACYLIRIDYRKFNKREEYDDYVMLFEDSGWKHIYGDKDSGKQYFERAKADASEEIFSDSLSKAERNRRLSHVWLGLFAVYLPTLMVFSMNGIFDYHKMLHPKELYLTPGLWEMTGGQFWRHFLFETPFALGRGFSGLLFLLIVFGYAYCGVKAYYWYWKEKKIKN